MTVLISHAALFSLFKKTPLQVLLFQAVRRRHRPWRMSIALSAPFKRGFKRIATPLKQTISTFVRRTFPRPANARRIVLFSGIGTGKQSKFESRAQAPFTFRLKFRNYEVANRDKLSTGLQAILQEEGGSGILASSLNSKYQSPAHDASSFTLQ